MIQQIGILAQPANSSGNIDLEHQADTNSCHIKLTAKNSEIAYTQLTVVICLDYKITHWREHDYKWYKANQTRIANYYSPKVLKLANGQFLMADRTTGIWEFNPNKPKQLLWHIHHYEATPVFSYGYSAYRDFTQQEYLFTTLELGLLITDKPLEWSRSTIPFSSILSFTDHCDFDSLLLVKNQRELFKQNNIITTKGVFKYHYSKRDYNVSLEKEKEVAELKLWEEDGHEIAYHSLSQSVRQWNKAWEDFDNMQNDYFPISTWIDHGYQPYNLTMRQYEEDGPKEDINLWLNKIKSKGIDTLWNYIDSFEVQPNIINQVNPDDTRYAPIADYTGGYSFKSKISNRIRNYILYFASEKTKSHYWRLLKLKHKVKKNPFLIFEAIYKGLSVGRLFLKVIINSNNLQKKVSSASKYTPVIFKIKNGQQGEITIFQTGFIRDYNQAFSSDNLTKLVSEAGVCIAHTYLGHYDSKKAGTFFKNSDGEITDNVKGRYKEIGDRIKAKEIWNPTLKDMVSFFNNFEHLRFEVNEKGEVVKQNNPKTERIITRRIDDRVD